MHDEKTPYIGPPRRRSVLLRRTWMAALPLILLSAFLLADEERWTFGTRDVVLLLLVAAAISARATAAVGLVAQSVTI